MNILKVSKVFSHLVRKYPHYSDNFVNFENIFEFSKSNRHLLRGFLNVIDEFRLTMQRGGYLTEGEYQLLDEVLLELELAIALETSLR